MTDTPDEAVTTDAQEGDVPADAAQATTPKQAEAAQGETGSDLDALLAEFSEYQRTEPEDNASTDEDDTDDDSEYVKRSDLDKYLQKQKDKSEAEAKTQSDIADAVKLYKGDTDIPDHIARAVLEAEAQKDQRIANAFFHRHEKPEAWKKIVQAKGREFQAMIAPKSETSKTADEITSAVRASSTKAPNQEPEDGMKVLREKGIAGYEAYRRKQLSNR